MHAISVIARLTFREALRRRIALAALLLGVAFLILVVFMTFVGWTGR